MGALRKHLSMPSLLSTTLQDFKRIPNQTAKGSTIALSDCLMSGLALFSLKYPSLLKFDNDRSDDIIRHNLQSLFGVEHIPSDTYLRERLDAVSPDQLRKPFSNLFAQVQRGNELASFKFMEDHYLLSVDGTGYFSSHQIHCEQCCVKNHRDGSKTYYHQLLGAALVHPDHSQV